MKLSLTFSDVTNKSLVEFYSVVAEKAGFDSSIGQYDCRHIEVSEKIQDLWFKEFELQGIKSSEIAIALLLTGPKVNKKLQDYEVEIDDSFYSIKYPETINLPIVADYYYKAYGKILDEPMDIPYDAPSIVLYGNHHFIHLFWSSEHNDVCQFVDYTIYDEDLEEIDGGLFPTEHTDNLVDAFYYFQDKDFEKYLGKREDWKLVDEEAIINSANYVMKHEFIFDDDMVDNISRLLSVEYGAGIALENVIRNIVTYVSAQGLDEEESIDMILSFFHGLPTSVGIKCKMKEILRR